MSVSYTFSDQIKIYPSEGGSGWHYVLIPKENYSEIREIASQFKRGFGSVKVEAQIGDTIWKTSIFPDTDKKQFIMFLKKKIRQENSLEAGGVAAGSISLILPVIES